MKFKTILEYLIDEIRSDLNDIQSTVNSPSATMKISVDVKGMICSIKEKLDMICEKDE